MNGVFGTCSWERKGKRDKPRWTVEGSVAIGYQGKHLEISVPHDLFPRESGQGLDFKWVDNVSLKSLESLFLEGDVAPDRRFNFRY